jgi:hypothetical protein
VNYLALMIAWPFASLFAMMPFCALVRAGQEEEVETPAADEVTA